MSNAFIGEIRIFPYTRHVPNGWLECLGQRVKISDYTPLYVVIGTAYGASDQQTYFTLPNLAGVTTMGVGQAPGLTARIQGRTVGQAGVTLNPSNTPPHSHVLNTMVMSASKYPNNAKSGPTANVSYPGRYVDLSVTPSVSYLAYNPAVPAAGSTTQPTSPQAMALSSLSPTPTTAATAHENQQPFQVLRYYICATDGFFPPRP